MSDREDLQPPGPDSVAGGSEKWLDSVYGFQETLLNALTRIQPLVVLFSLSIVVAAFTLNAFPQASSWSVVAAFGFGWAMVFFAVLRILNPKGRRARVMTIIHLYAYLGVFLGFFSLGVALYVLTLGNALVNRAYTFMGLEIFSLIAVASAYRTSDWVSAERRHARGRRESGHGWSILGWVNVGGLVLAVFGPPLLIVQALLTEIFSLQQVQWISGCATVAWALGTGIVVSGRASLWLLSRQ